MGFIIWCLFWIFFWCLVLYTYAPGIGLIILQAIILAVCVALTMKLIFEITAWWRRRKWRRRFQ